MRPEAQDGRTRAALGLILAFAAGRLAFAATLGLGQDEAYTLVVSRPLALSYFDHPPLHQWLAHFAALAFGENVAPRLPFVALFALTGWLVFSLTRALYGAQAALSALVALNVAPFFFASAGSWIVPDGPLLAALAAAALALTHVFFGASGPPGSVGLQADDVAAPRRPGGRCSERWRTWALWLAAGLAFGLAGLSKYSAALPALGVLGFLATSPSHRRWLRHPAPYVAAALAALIVSPVFVWNAEHGWASFLFQGERGAPSDRGGALGVLTMLLGEGGYLLPWLFVSLIVAAVAGWRAGEARARLLIWLGLPTIILFSIAPAWGASGLPHWAMPGWFLLFPLLGQWLERLSSEVRRRWALGSALAVVAVALLAIVQQNFGLLQRILGPDIPDPMFETLDWGALKTAPALNPRPAFVATTKWWEAGKVGVALGPDQPLFVFSDDPRGVAFLDKSARFVGRDGVVITEPRRLDYVRSVLGPYFQRLDAPETFDIPRSGRKPFELVLVRAHNLTRAFPLPYRQPGN